jgi:hypothetical protein
MAMCIQRGRELQTRRASYGCPFEALAARRLEQDRARVSVTLCIDFDAELNLAEVVWGASWKIARASVGPHK